MLMWYITDEVDDLTPKEQIFVMLRNLVTNENLKTWWQMKTWKPGDKSVKKEQPKKKKKKNMNYCHTILWSSNHKSVITDTDQFESNVWSVTFCVF